jgi:hypothetical protein
MDSAFAIGLRLTLGAVSGACGCAFAGAIVALLKGYWSPLVQMTGKLFDISGDGACASTQSIACCS